MNDVVKTKQITPESAGWVRASKYDTPTSIVYERPDGTLQAFVRGKRAMLTVLIDE